MPFLAPIAVPGSHKPIQDVLAILLAWISVALLILVFLAELLASAQLLVGFTSEKGRSTEYAPLPTRNRTSPSTLLILSILFGLSTPVARRFSTMRVLVKTGASSSCLDDASEKADESAAIRGTLIYPLPYLLAESIFLVSAGLAYFAFCRMMWNIQVFLMPEIDTEMVPPDMRLGPADEAFFGASMGLAGVTILVAVCFKLWGESRECRAEVVGDHDAVAGP